MEFIYDDGGRCGAGYGGWAAHDCCVRAIAIATEQPYGTVFAALNAVAHETEHRRDGKTSSARNGMFRPPVRRYLSDRGWRWTPTMFIGSGCRVHLTADELPGGRLVVLVSKHLTAVIDGVIHDTQNPQRGGSRCVYGYWEQ